ncbi:Sugar phosphate isomerase/epimerase [Bryocella elongata]|uniref:Sugar phosphate isomerase/epimerase n=1 Tax=Bryocella elongata TaxID=863522 RepID=A0A1H5U619_9BACT|nr:sugar phosphate isomerase/epimerase [Bryocella elongata]SEF70555.1 Sugar phosphate isomerase/epimerase [Bryocella elongata]
MSHEVSRRNVLRGGALLAGSMMLPEMSATAAPMKMLGVPGFGLGLASYTFRNFNRSQMIGFMKQLGLTALNAKDAKDHLPMDPALEAAALADYNAAGIVLHAVGTVSFSKPDEADIKAKFEYAKRAGVKVIVSGDPDTRSLPIMERFAKEFDIRIAIHNHGPEDAKYFPSPLDVLKAVKGMDPRMGCCIDVGHCERAGTDPVVAIHAAGPRLFNMHVKDLTDFKSRESQVAVGQGKIPFRAIFEALGSIGYKGFVDLEYEINGDNPMPGVIESFAYMRGVLNGMGYQKA